MNGGKRGNKKGGWFSELELLPEPKVKPVVDPHPYSRIVRVKMRNGIPRQNQIRMGMSEEELKFQIESMQRRNEREERAAMNLAAAATTGKPSKKAKVDR